MRSIIKSGETLLWICDDRLPPSGYRRLHGFMLCDGRWLYEIEKDSPDAVFGSAFPKHDRIMDVDK